MLPSSGYNSASCPARIEQKPSPSHRVLVSACVLPYFFALLFRPQNALILGRHRREAFVDKSLHPLPPIRLRGVEVPFGIGRDAVDTVEFARLASAFPKAGQHFQRLTIQNAYLVGLAVRQVNIFLLRI